MKQVMALDRKVEDNFSIILDSKNTYMLLKYNEMNGGNTIFSNHAIWLELWFFFGNSNTCP